MTTTIYKQQKVNSINTLICEIEESYNDNFSIIVYDEEGGVWIEKFADTYTKAVEVAEKLFAKVCKQY